MPSENQYHSHSITPNTQDYTYQDVGSGYSSYGYTCQNCGRLVNGTHTCYYYNPYPNYVPYSPPYSPPHQIIIQPQMFPIAVPVEVDIQRLDERLDTIEKTVEKLLDLLLNGQDEEVCGHSEEGCESVDCGGSPGTALEVVKPHPRGATTWPPRS